MGRHFLPQLLTTTVLPSCGTSVNHHCGFSSPSASKDLAGWLGSHCKCLALSSESLHFGFSCGLKGGGGVKHGASPIGGKGRQGQTLGPSARLG